MLFIVLIADAAQNAMANEHKSITDGIILVSTIAFWNYFLDWLSYKFRLFRRIITPRPVLLIKDGIIQRRNLRYEMITEEDLMSQLREQGIERVEEVKKSYIETEGHISVIKKHSKDEQGKTKQKKKQH